MAVRELPCSHGLRSVVTRPACLLNMHAGSDCVCTAGHALFYRMGVAA